MSLRPEIITSAQNPRIKELIKLLDRRTRKQTGLTRIDGARELLRALDGAVLPRVLYLCEELVRSEEGREALRRCREAEVPLQALSAQLSEHIAFGDRREGLCALVAWQPLALRELTLPELPLVLVVQGIEKPGNLGALLRTADAAGVDAVLLCDGVTDATNPNTIRASMGTLFTLPVAESSSAEAERFLREHGLQVYTARPESSRPYWQGGFAEPSAIVVGSEHSGLQDSWSGAGLTALSIPMRGKADSLNVNVSAAILLFEAVRQRG
ncbi:MAG TPA: RNA methyltransferase [Candidatus Krumholzibacteria bacterium]|nr:RNA methyltransferase [Candidatus Krumholzibacteria bacterium]